MVGFLSFKFVYLPVVYFLMGSAECVSDDWAAIDKVFFPLII